MNLTMKRYLMLLVSTFVMITLIVGGTVVAFDHNRAGEPTSITGLALDHADARGPVTLYCQSPFSVMRLTNLNWYNMSPCTSYHADALKPYVGTGFTYYNVANGSRYTARCYNLNNCSRVLVPPDGIRIVGTFHL